MNKKHESLDFSLQGSKKTGTRLLWAGLHTYDNDREVYPYRDLSCIIVTLVEPRQIKHEAAAFS